MMLVLSSRVQRQDVSVLGARIESPQRQTLSCISSNITVSE